MPVRINTGYFVAGKLTGDTDHSFDWAGNVHSSRWQKLQLIKSHLYLSALYTMIGETRALFYY
jgi:hypothetical protein